MHNLVKKEMLYPVEKNPAARKGTLDSVARGCMNLCDSVTRKCIMLC
jgi:hypothetical protein